MKFMTDTQCAYIAGRDVSIPLGGVDCHAYFEFKCGEINEEKLANAWKKLFVLHPELRAEYKNGMIIDKQELPACSIMSMNDISACDENIREKFLSDMRSKISRRICHTESGECCGLYLIRTDSQKHVLIFDWSLVVGDVKSFVLILNELSELYNDEAVLSSRIESDAVYEMRKNKAGMTRKLAEKIINSDIEKYPIKISLPTIADHNALSSCNYLSADRYVDNAEKIIGCGFPDAKLMYAFTAAFCELTGNNGLLVNYPCFLRTDDEHSVVGDLTDIKLVPVHYNSSISDMENYRDVLETYKRYMSFSGYKQAKIRRQISKHFSGVNVTVPIVFSPVCDIPLLSDNFINKIGRLNYMISQTPQVWLDVQTFLLKNRFYISMVYPQELFEVAFVENLADKYAEKINLMIKEGV